MQLFRTMGSKFALAGGVAVLAAAPATPQQQVSPPVARYTMDVGTISGMGAMGANAGNGGGGLAGAMAMLRGGNSQVAREMVLKIGSTRTAANSHSDHFVPSAMRMGASVPLVTPAQASGTPAMPQQAQLPKGRLLLFWGCGEKAPRGQPVVIDFAKMAQGQVPPDLYFAGLNLPEDWQVTQANSRTYAEWPNARATRTVPANASLVGPHRVVSSYAPEIAFNLEQDFMGPLNPTSGLTAGNAVSLNWTGLPNANGYYAWAFGAKDAGNGQQPTDMVWWSSSGARAFGGALADWLSPATVRRLVDQKMVMPPSQTSCTIPAEVKAAAGEVLMTQLYAYGPQADFAFPARPSDPKVAWKPEWIARVRYRSQAMVMAGMPGMAGMGAEQPAATQGSTSTQQGTQQPAQPAQPVLPPCPRGLAGIAARAAKLCF